MKLMGETKIASPYFYLLLSVWDWKGGTARPVKVVSGEARRCHVTNRSIAESTQ